MSFVEQLRRLMTCGRLGWIPRVKIRKNLIVGWEGELTLF